MLAVVGQCEEFCDFRTLIVDTHQRRLDHIKGLIEDVPHPNKRMLLAHLCLSDTFSYIVETPLFLALVRNAPLAEFKRTFFEIMSILVEEVVNTEDMEECVDGIVRLKNPETTRMVDRMIKQVFACHKSRNRE